MSERPRKRKLEFRDGHEKSKKTKGEIPTIEISPPVNNLNDLIKVGNTKKYYKNINCFMLWKIIPYLEDLTNMIGMESLKDTVFHQVLYYLQCMHLRNIKNEYLHTMIFGPPGTGKTTVSRIIGKIYQKLGILSENGPFKIAHRDDFIAGYLGQTALKTRKLLESCIGGILFVDEVYSLCPRDSDKDSFSDETIETITSFLSEYKDNFCFIGAGYEEDITARFFGKNKGLERRFQWIHRIEKYTPVHLTDIMLKMIKEIGWEINVNKKNLIDIITKNEDLFKNAGGDIEIFISKCKIAHAKRVFLLDMCSKFIITKEDIINALEMVKDSKLNEKKNETDVHLSMYL